MLSEATPVTRLAYIKFMKPTIRKEQDEDVPPETAGASTGAPSTLTASKKKGVKKSILRAAAVDLEKLLIFHFIS